MCLRAVSPWLLRLRRSLPRPPFFFSCSGDHRDLHSFPTRRSSDLCLRQADHVVVVVGRSVPKPGPARSEEHTSELQSLTNLVCRLLLEKKKDTSGSSHSSASTARGQLSLLQATRRSPRSAGALQRG